MAEEKYRWYITKNEGVSLVPSDPNVRSLSNRLGWKADTLIARVQKALPQKLEQDMFLHLTVDWRVPLHPETFRSIYLYFTNGQWLSNHDLEDRKLGENIYSNKGEKIIDQLSLTMNLLHWQKEQGYFIGWRTAAHLVQAYGEDAEDILSMIAESLDEIMEERRMKMSHRKAFAVIVKNVADIAANGSKNCALPNVSCVDDIITLLSSFASSSTWEHNEEEE
ncbi:MAG: hypothetical protein G01um101433_425 [Parcubacteria group bacterium Gr01-1014_33]|nr:MAG: hypothetical protein G01um101433_425 [Parcubacteria group bacterium Gr01-1014_33]